MIVVMKPGATPKQVDHIVERIEQLGLRSHVIVGTEVIPPALRALELLGSRHGFEVAFDHFAIPRSRFEAADTFPPRASFSLRPQSIHLLRQPSTPGSACLIPGRIVQRAYLGEHWDYTVRPADSGLLLRVTARPHEIFDVDESVWLELDPRQLARIE